MGSSGLEPPTSRLSGVRSNHLSYEPISVAVCGLAIFGLPVFRLLESLPTTPGGDEQNRTVDPLLARQVLSQLSYTPMSHTGLPLFGRVCCVHRFSKTPVGPSKLNNALNKGPTHKHISVFV